MIKFNSDHLIVGQIKEKLSSFEMPTCRVYADGAYDDNGRELNVFATVKRVNGSFPNGFCYAPYIKDGIIQLYVKSGDTYAWEPSNQVFAYGMPIPGMTRRMRLSGNIYDSHTHEYLGEYLRFKRDYEGIDLMPLYNCFSGTVCQSAKLCQYKIGESNYYKIDTDDNASKVYMLPVKMFREYTIAIDCTAGVEICCGLYGKYQDETNEAKAFNDSTYVKENCCVFSSPFVYRKLNDSKFIKSLSQKALAKLAKGESELKMFIKLPAGNNSSITVLEGDYRHYNDGLLRFTETNGISKLVRVQNRAVTNFEVTDTIESGEENDFSHFKPVTPLQLLRMNTKESYPFADRLIEYILGNVIDSSDEIIDDIKRVKNVIALNAEYPDNYNVDAVATKGALKPGKGKLISELKPEVDGLWIPAIRPIVYDKFNTTVTANRNDTNHDILGYIDKDIEAVYSANVLDKTSKYFVDKASEKAKKRVEGDRVTISNIDIYTTVDGLYDEGEDE